MFVGSDLTRMKIVASPLDRSSGSAAVQPPLPYSPLPASASSAKRPRSESSAKASGDREKKQKAESSEDKDDSLDEKHDDAHEKPEADSEKRESKSQSADSERKSKRKSKGALKQTVRLFRMLVNNAFVCSVDARWLCQGPHLNSVGCKDDRQAGSSRPKLEGQGCAG